MTDKFKDHFVKMAVNLISKGTAQNIIRDICLVNKIPARQMRKIQNEILSCEYIQEKEKEIIPEKINELNYVK